MLGLAPDREARAGRAFDGDGLTIVVESAADVGGQERIADALLRRYPRAAAVALSFRSAGQPGDPRPWCARRIEFQGRRRGRRRGYLAPLYAMRLARTELPDSRIVLSLTHGGWTLAAPLPSGARRIAYSSGLNTWMYGLSPLALRSEELAARLLVPALRPALRAFDKRLMTRPHSLVANSLHTAHELSAALGRAADGVLHPPVRTDYFTPGPNEPSRGGHYLMVARVTAQKRVREVVEAFRGLDFRLVVAGAGSWLERLRASAPRNVELIGAADDATLLGLYRSSRGLICPSTESFGIAMAEALSAGRPVIAARAGGALEIVEHGRTGLLLDAVAPPSIAAAVEQLERLQPDSKACRASVQRFSERAFGESMDGLLLAELAKAGG